MCVEIETKLSESNKSGRHIDFWFSMFLKQWDTNYCYSYWTLQLIISMKQFILCTFGPRVIWHPCANGWDLYWGPCSTILGGTSFEHPGVDTVKTCRPGKQFSKSNYSAAFNYEKHCNTCFPLCVDWKIWINCCIYLVAVEQDVLDVLILIS